MRILISFCCFFLFSQSFSQAISNQEKIKTYIQTYFLYDREIIHVQFNKNSYVNNEDIAFKGYVYSKNNNAPHLNTANVQLAIYNDKQEIVQTQLLYTTNGTFKGGIHLTDKFKAGKYYFRFFTNWMNNFKEDDSFTQTIEIINKNDPYQLNSTEPNWKTAQVTFFPESGNIIDGMANTIGVKITDCNRKGIELNDIIIQDSKSNEVTRFKTNKMGNGIFYLIPDITEKYTLKINTNELNLSKSLPKTQETGIILTYNNKLNNNKLAVAIRTNEKGAELYENKKFNLLIQQDGKFSQAEIGFSNKELEKVVVLDNKYLSNGVNSIRLIDESLNEICERLIFKHPAYYSSTSLEAKTIANDSIKLSGKPEVNKADISISVLPEKNISFQQQRSILGTFYLNAYLENPEIDNYIYFDVENNNRIKDMDLLMLNQNHSKYSWENIKSNPPKINYAFQKGVTISGKVEKELKPNSKYKLSLISLKDNVIEETPIDINNEFKFENFYAKDSTVFILQMMNEKNTVVNTKIQARVIRNEFPFVIPLKLDEANCPIVKNENETIVLTNPKSDEKIINLKDVNIINNYKKEVFTHKDEMNFTASGYKIDDNQYGTFLNFLTMHGYRTGIDPETNDVYIQSNRNQMGGTSQPPSIYVDNDLVFDFNFLFNLDLQDIDEIYIDQTGSSDIYGGGNGTIKVFLKLDRHKNDYFNKKYTSFIVTKGFSDTSEFKNALFDTQQGFYNFGTLFWSPNLSLTENPNFEIKFPRGNQKEIRVLIEGINMEGQLISEVKTIPVSNQ